MRCARWIIFCLVLPAWVAALLGADAPAAAPAAAPVAAPADAPTQAIMPLSEIKPGMKGEWRTTIQGTAITTFPLEVLGVMENFSGPRRSIIICQALDPSQIQNGPVAGMSGSPVYIDGKLVGAYAYGFEFPKDQALIGVTPIEDMMETLNAPSAPELPGRPGPPRIIPADSSSGNATATSASGGQFAPAWGGGDNASDWRVTLGADRLPEGNVASVMHPLPTPLMVSGISAHTLAVFKNELERRGLDVVQAPGGGTSDGGPSASSLQPGSPIGAVLLSGDFSISGVGTLTWRQGDRMLAFGHPMFQFGAVDIPLATAEVVTIVRSYERSFKLANVGPIVGTISQDRQTAIAGTIGPVPEMTAFRAHVTDPAGATRTFQGELWPNRDMAPVIGAMGLLESLSSTEQTAQEQTFFVNATLDIQGFPPVHLTQVSSGPGGADEAATGFMAQYDELMSNPFEFPHVRSMDFDVHFQDTWLTSNLDSIRVDSGPLHPGDTLRVTLSVANYRDVPTEHTLEIPIPDSAENGTLSLFVGDADSADALDRGAERRDFTSLADVVNYIQKSRSRGAVYVKLLRTSSGVRVAGSSLPGLPPSVESLYLSPKNLVNGSITSQITLWETTLPVPGEFSGHTVIPVNVLP